MLLIPASAQAAARPTITGSISDSVALSGASSVAISGHYAYTTAYYAGRLVAIDISDPAHPRIAGMSPTATSLIDAVTVNVSGGYAYVVSKNRNASPTSNDDGTGNSLTILDIATNPAQPAIVGAVHDPQHLFGAYGVAVAGHYAYVAAQGLLALQPTVPDTSTGAFDVIDLSNPSSPSIVATIDNGALPAPWTGSRALFHADSISIDGNDAYVTASRAGRMTVINIADPLAPVIVASLADGSAQAPTGTLPFPVDVVAQGGYAYVVSQIDPGRLAVVDVSDPTNPHVVGSLASPALNAAYRIRIRAHSVFVSAEDSASVSQLDVSDPSAPSLTSSVTSPAHLNSTLGLDIDPTGHFLVASSPALPSETDALFPPFPLQPGGATVTGTVTVLNLDPIAVTIAPTSKPRDPTTSTRASFAFSTNDPVASILCSLDGRRFGPCTTPRSQRYSSLHIGRHTFTVLSGDPDGSVATASYAWAVLRPAPVVTRLRQGESSWSEALTKSARRGTVFTFTLNESAGVTLTFTRLAPGRRVAGRCVGLSHGNANEPRCTLGVLAGALFVRGHKGRNATVFTGRVMGRRTLRPGRYTMALTAMAAGTEVSLAKTLSFTILG